MVMVKAFAYGSGGFEIANLLQNHQVDYLAVAYADEGVELRKKGIKLPIMVMNPQEEDFHDEDEYENALHKFKERVGDMKQRLARQTYNATTLFDQKPQREGILIKTKRMKEQGAAAPLRPPAIF